MTKLTDHIYNTIQDDGIEIPFEVEMPEGEIEYDWVSNIVIEVISFTLQIEPADIQVSNRFQQDLGADSLDIVEINLKLEKMLSIDVPDHYLGLIITVEDAVQIVFRALRGELEL